MWACLAVGGSSGRMLSVAVCVDVMVAAFGRWQVMGCGLGVMLETGL